MTKRIIVAFQIAAIVMQSITMVCIIKHSAVSGPADADYLIITQLHIIEKMPDYLST